ncbi:hypothetical protein [Bartonella sp. CB178]|uniref:hypothetical protein n=1 Tax=Bartonella sp. CB178 TaxID=3112255 RepID=UPI00300DCFBC
MTFFPFSIADIKDPERIRVVLYASGRMGHAPLNALSAQMRQDIDTIDKKLTENMVQTSQQLDALEQKLGEFLRNMEAVEQEQKIKATKKMIKKQNVKILK